MTQLWSRLLPLSLTLSLASMACIKQVPVVVPQPPRCELRPAPTWPAPQFTACDELACITAEAVNNLWLYQRDVERWEAEVSACGGQPVSTSVGQAVQQSH